MNNPQKAAPREKPAVPAEAPRYRITNTPHFIGGDIHPVGAIVQLPAGIKPGKYLVEVDTAGNPVKPDKGAKAE